jgi:hypothetical protein
MPLESLLENKLEFMIQAHQPSTVVDGWAFYEFQIYIDLLNKRNKEKNTKEETNNNSNNSSNGIINKIGNLANKFKK